MFLHLFFQKVKSGHTNVILLKILQNSLHVKFISVSFLHRIWVNQSSHKFAQHLNIHWVSQCLFPFRKCVEGHYCFHSGIIHRIVEKVFLSLFKSIFVVFKVKVFILFLFFQIFANKVYFFERLYKFQSLFESNTW